MKKTVFTAAVLLLSATMIAGCTTAKDATTDKNATSGDASASGSAEKAISISDYNLDDYVTLGDYNQVKVEVKYDQVSQDDINSYANKVAAQYPDYKKTDKKTVEDGDVVNIDYVGTRDGEEFDGGSDTDFNLTIGSNQFIDGFEDGLIGKKVGDKVTLNLTFPEDYSVTDLAGKDVVFHVTINAIMEEVIYTVDQFTDEYVKANFGFDTVDEFLADVKSSLEDDNKTDKESNTRQAIISAVLDVCKVTVPDELLTYKIKDYKEQYMNMVESKGYEFTDFLSSNFNQTPQEWAASVAKSMQTSLEQEMVFAAIADQENIQVDEEGYADYVEKFVSYYSYEDENALYEDYSKEDLQRSYRCDQVIAKLKKSLTITYTKNQ